MTDQDYIHKAVDLADGWLLGTIWDGSPEDGSAVRIFYYEGQNGYWYLEHPPQPAIDALAAQLVRQVDALGLDLVSVRTGVEIMGQSVFENSDDRTMNTIKAIVDSKALS